MERPETFHRLRAVHVMKRRASCQAPAFASISASIQPALFTLFTAVHIPQGAEGGERRKMGVSHANSVGRPGRGVRLPARQRPRDSDGPEARGLRARPTRTPADPGPAGSCVRRTRGPTGPRSRRRLRRLLRRLLRAAGSGPNRPIRFPPADPNASSPTRIRPAAAAGRLDGFRGQTGQAAGPASRGRSALRVRTRARRTLPLSLGISLESLRPPRARAAAAGHYGRSAATNSV